RDPAGRDRSAGEELASRQRLALEVARRLGRRQALNLRGTVRGHLEPAWRDRAVAAPGAGNPSLAARLVGHENESFGCYVLGESLDTCAEKAIKARCASWAMASSVARSRAASSAAASLPGRRARRSRFAAVPRGHGPPATPIAPRAQIASICFP